MAEKEKRLTCWSCENYVREQMGPHMWHHGCRADHGELVPHAGSFDCEDFYRLPGADEEERA